MKKIDGNESGLSIIEGMIAAAIVSIIAITISYFVIGLNKTSIKVTGSQECANTTQSLLSEFKIKDNFLLINNFIPSPANQTPTGLGVGRIAAPFVSPSRQEFYHFQNIETASTRLLQILTAFPQACGQFISAATIGSTVPIPSGYSASIKITPINTQTNQPLPCTPTDILKVRPNSQTGFLVEAEYAGNSPTTANQSCHGQIIVGYANDKNPPTIQFIDVQKPSGPDWIGALEPGTLEGPGVSNTICDQPSAKIHLKSSEPGSLFMCRNISPAGSWEYCDGFQIAGGGTGATLRAVSGTPNIPTEADLIFSGLPNGKYRFEAKSIDSAFESSGVTPNNESPPVTVFFTIDLVRPQWSQPPPRKLTPVGNPVGLAKDLPASSLFTAGDARADQFGTNANTSPLYQCSATSVPQFSGAIDSNMGNELCDGLTNQTQVASGVVTTGSCLLTVPASPAYTPGQVVLTANVHDICGTHPTGASTSIDWYNDPPGAVKLNGHHTFTSFNPLPAPPVDNGGPAWTARYQRPNPILTNMPLVLEVPHVDGTTATQVMNNESVTANISPTNQVWSAFSNKSCYYDRGFCMKLVGPCGQEEATVANPPPVAGVPPTTTRYAVKGIAGSSCWEAPCMPGLQCSLGSSDTGICKTKTANGGCGRWKCHNKHDCDGINDCIDPSTGLEMPDTNTTNTGVCNGTRRYCTGIDYPGDCLTDDGSVGRCVGNAPNALCQCPSEDPIGFFGDVAKKDALCPSYPVGWQALCAGVSPACTCDATIASAHCPSFTFDNSCGVPNACRGTGDRTKTEICRQTEVVPLVTPICPSLVWYGPNSTSIALSATGGIPGSQPNAYSFECSTSSATSGFSASCNPSTWPESPVKPASPMRSFWLKAIDSRGDFEVVRCQYMLDLHPPTFPIAAKITDDTCGTPTSPTLGDSVSISYRADDTHSKTLIEARNITINPAPAPTTTCQNQNRMNTTCNLSMVDVDSETGPAGQIIRLTATDEAGNSATSSVTAAVARSMGLTLTNLVATSATNWARYGGGAVMGIVSPYSDSPITANISGGNTNNYIDGGISYHRCIAPLATGVCPQFQFASNYSGFDSYRSFATKRGISFFGGPSLNFSFYGDGVMVNWLQQVDQCGNLSNQMRANTYLDWQAPVLESKSCNQNQKKVTVSFTDAGSGMAQVRGGCTKRGVGGSYSLTSGVSSASGILGSGIFDCRFDARDKVGNDTEEPNYYGGPPTTVLKSCTFPGECVPPENEVALGVEYNDDAGLPGCVGASPTPAPGVCEPAQNTVCLGLKYANSAGVANACTGSKPTCTDAATHCGSYTDGCGTSCTGSLPTPCGSPSPTPDCSCAANTCEGVKCNSNLCNGTKQPSCDGIDTSTYCAGVTQTGQCGKSCEGTLPNTCSGISCSDWKRTHCETESVSSSCGVTVWGSVQKPATTCTGGQKCTSNNSCELVCVADATCPSCGCSAARTDQYCSSEAIPCDTPVTGRSCTGTKVGTCDGSSTCVGRTAAGSCGTSCPGTMAETCGGTTCASWQSSHYTSVTVDSNCGTTYRGTKCEPGGHPVSDGECTCQLSGSTEVRCGDVHTMPPGTGADFNCCNRGTLALTFEGTTAYLDQRNLLEKYITELLLSRAYASCGPDTPPATFTWRCGAD